jgi:hypothetical protein
MKVRLVRPLLVEIAQRDPQAPAASYDPDFREPVLGPPDASGIGARQRPSMAPVQVPAQVETGTFERLQQAMSGNIPDTRLVLVLDYEDLARRGLVDAATGEATLHTGDRLVRILSGAGVVRETFPHPPGMFITELRPGFGLAGDRNLLLAFCDDREQGLVRGA